jgi:DDE_Tnp_1-associated
MKFDSEMGFLVWETLEQPVLSILREVRDPRAPNARHELSAILFIALAATLCGQKSCVHIADFGAVNEAELAEIVELPHGAPSHDCFSRVLRLLDPAELAKALARLSVRSATVWISALHGASSPWMGSPCARPMNAVVPMRRR